MNRIWHKVRLNLTERFTDIQQMQLKAYAIFLGVFLLLFFLVIRCLLVLLQEEEPEPVIRTLKNVWIMEQGENWLKIYEEGTVKDYYLAEEYIMQEQCREQVADITLTDEQITAVDLKLQKEHGKVLAVTSAGVELEGIGFLPFQNGWKGYRLFQSLKLCGREEIRVGYDFADFVMEEGAICAVLLVREEVMEYIRVLLLSSEDSSRYHQQVTVTCDTDFMMQFYKDGLQYTTEYPAGSMLEVDATEEALLQGRIRIVPQALTGRLTLESIERSQGTPAYRGCLELLGTEEGIVVINEVLLEEYLYSVVPSEMPASYPAEALKAQAVCARTYAYKRMLSAGLPQYGAHVDDSTGYQVYNNISEQETTTTAVKETFGRVLVDSAELLPADTYYYSTSCGLGTDGDIWSVEKDTTPSYLQAGVISRNRSLTVPQNEAELTAFLMNPDPEAYEAGEDWYRWQYEVAEVDHRVMYERLLERYEATPERILTLTEEGRYESLTPKVWEKLHSMKITEREDGGAVAALVLETDQGMYQVLTEYNIRYVLCDGETKAIRQNGKPASAATLLPSGFFVIVTQDSPKKGYLLLGGGHGHGVGMSQNGARNMALDGMNAEEILTFFYKGCQIESMYH